jgi:hypothetical protein
LSVKGTRRVKLLVGRVEDGRPKEDEIAHRLVQLARLSMLPSNSSPGVAQQQENVGQFAPEELSRHVIGLHPLLQKFCRSGLEIVVTLMAAAGVTVGLDQITSNIVKYLQIHGSNPIKSVNKLVRMLLMLAALVLRHDDEQV